MDLPSGVAACVKENGSVLTESHALEKTHPYTRFSRHRTRRCLEYSHRLFHRVVRQTALGKQNFVPEQLDLKSEVVIDKD